ncbi:AAA family ATPase [Pyrococcus kukulkanii]|uniref:AAA family ATPase n=1 Tax=Pyrococcus kukulkanii TaxID=1609559 RepID=UPI003569A342
MPVLTTLTVENYKSIERVRLEFSRINLLIGPNGSGKSSILEAFGLLAGKLVPFSDREFEKVVHMHDSTRKIVITGEFREFPFAKITYEAPPFTKKIEGDEKEIRKLLHVLTANRQLERTHRGVSRDYPKTPEDAVRLFYYACYRSEFRNNIRTIRKFYSRYGLNDVRWVPTEDNEYEIIATTEEGIDINLADAGSGLVALFPVIVALAFYPKKSAIFIEHPEMHLHPKIQYELAEFLVDVMKEREYQIVIETHSEHLLYGLLNKVAEGSLKPQNLTVYSAKKVQGKSIFNKMAVNEDGSIEGELSDFFEADLRAFLDWLKV